MQERFDFNSPEASKILANMAQMATQTPSATCRGGRGRFDETGRKTACRLPGTALENAAARGNIEMLRELLSTGIKDADAKTSALDRARLCWKNRCRTPTHPVRCRSHCTACVDWRRLLRNTRCLAGDLEVQA